MCRKAPRHQGSQPRRPDVRRIANNVVETAALFGQPGRGRPPPIRDPRREGKPAPDAAAVALRPEAGQLTRRQVIDFVGRRPAAAGTKTSGSRGEKTFAQNGGWGKNPPPRVTGGGKIRQVNLDFASGALLY